MTNCLLCQQPIVPKLNLTNVFWRKGFSPMICSQCEQDFDMIDPTKSCQWCGRSQFEQGICEDCQKWQKVTSLLKNRALFTYNAKMHDLFHDYKRQGDYVLYKVFTTLIQSALKTFQMGKYDFYIPLPTDPVHQDIRGFDPVTGIFMDSFKLTPLLGKKSIEKAQSQKSRQERLKTPQTFCVDNKIEISGKCLLLDDIYTTGRTLYHARDALLRVYPNLKIDSLTIAR